MNINAFSKSIIRNEEIKCDVLLIITYILLKCILILLPYIIYYIYYYIYVSMNKIINKKKNN